MAKFLVFKTETKISGLSLDFFIMAGNGYFINLTKRGDYERKKIN